MNSAYWPWSCQAVNDCSIRHPASHPFIHPFSHSFIAPSAYNAPRERSTWDQSRRQMVPGNHAPITQWRPITTIHLTRLVPMGMATERVICINHCTRSHRPHSIDQSSWNRRVLLAVRSFDCLFFAHTPIDRWLPFVRLWAELHYHAVYDH